jgi:hypothetical protein
MPLPVLPGVLRIVVSGQIAGGGQWANTWHARNDSLVDFTPASINAFHAIFLQLYEGPSLGGGTFISNNIVSPSSITNYAYTPLDGSSGAFNIASATLGITVAPSMPAEVCEVLTIRTAARGRQNRGRIYFPAFRTDDFDSAGLILAGTISTLLTQVVAVESAIEAGGAHLGVGSYGPYKDPVTHLLVTTGQHFTPVTTWSMDNKADVQRRRKT